ncbi:hypothetical protein CEXT_5011 [Caerostris extrusa]|uniref:Uncharacterized protein n=1 Tax=Caerostris extrusa TaxID=172846 RepID=A0AAV4VVC0_CAEEX|nr:hypothetical protein CEXT_5011 [Caerostris extrusa]
MFPDSGSGIPGSISGGCIPGNGILPRPFSGEKMKKIDPSRPSGVGSDGLGEQSHRFAACFSVAMCNDLPALRHRKTPHCNYSRNAPRRASG